MADTETNELEAAPVEMIEPTRPEPPAKPEPTPAAITPAKQTRKGGWLGPILGGVIAAGAGYGLAQYVPNGWPLQDTSALQAALTAQQQETAMLKTQLAELAARSGDAGLETRLAALEATAPPDLAPLDTRLITLESRLTAIEALPTNGDGASSAVLAAQDAAIKQLQTQLQALQNAAPVVDTAASEALLKEAEMAAAKIKADAETMAKTAESRAALGRLKAALDSGAAYAAALPALGQVPEILTANAATGLPTLAALQDSFPEAARAALEAALRANMGESWTDRVTSFLRSQTGARSLAPREGSDPDAILSRAEAALATGDLATALTEIAALPPEAQTALHGWRSTAEIRMAAQQAVAGLAATIGE